MSKMSLDIKDKKSLDAHVADVFSKLTSEKEKSLRCWSFAKQYFRLRECATARRYLENYIASQPNNLGEAYKLMGDIYTEENNSEKALSYYKAAYEKGTSQALSYVCDLLRRGVGHDSEDARQTWFERHRSTPTSLNTSAASSRAVYQNPFTYANAAIANGSTPSRVRSPALQFATVTNGNANGSWNAGMTGDSSYGYKTPPEMLSPPNHKTSTPKLHRVYPSPDRIDYETCTQSKAIEEKLQQTLDQNKVTLDRMSEMLEEIKNLRIEVNELKQNQTQSFSEVYRNTASPMQATGQQNVTDSPKPAVAPAPTMKAVTKTVPAFSIPDPAANKSPSEIFKKPEGSWGGTNSYSTNTEEPAASANAKNISAPEVPGTGSNPPAAEPAPFTFAFKPIGFGDLTQSQAPSIFSNTSASPFTGFENAGKPLFANVAAKKSESNEPEHDEDEPDDFVPTAEFEPVIPLPPLVEVKKGDEDDDVVHEIRAKLYRFETATKEWKERGVGNIKIVQNKINRQQIRVLMWRERVLKLACNHLINRDMVIDYAQKSGKHLTWTAVDYSEPEAKLEKFLCKFTNETQCADFKKHFDDMVAFMKTCSSPNTTDITPVSQGVATAPSTAPAVQKSLSEIFKKPVGSWDCTDCYSTNTKESTMCAACNARNPNAPEQAVSDADATQKVADPAPFAFGFKPIGFGDLTQSQAPSIFSNTSATPFTGFQDAGKPLFANVAAKKSESKETEHDEDEPDDFVPTAEFEPVIPLPPLVEVKKGDEDDDVVHEIRAKLYRFETATKEWKERGVGNIKIVQNKINRQQIRVLMWRERVLKLACNHLINRDMVIDYAQKSEKHLTWTAVDYSEPEAKLEKFLCKFSNETQCADFKKHFDDMVAFMKTCSSSNTTPVSQGVATAPSTAPAVQKSLSEIFKKPEGSWDCTDCYSTNTKESTMCAACNARNPNAPEQAVSDADATQKVADPTPFTFGFKPIGFGDLTQSQAPSIFSNTSATPFTGFQDAGKPLFANVAGKISESKETEHDEDEPDDFVPTAEFEPVIPLPPLVEVKKGDEEDDVVHEIRAKLYRYETATKEWKERGVGNIKIVQNKINRQQIRVLMWRERVLKLACNHLINRDMAIDYAQKSEKHLTWTAVDYSEPEAKLEKFLCKFSNETQCTDFKKHFDEMVAFMKTCSSPNVTPTSTAFVPPAASAEEKPQAAATVQPPQLIHESIGEPCQQCPGCSGCDPDSFDFKKLDGRNLPAYPEQTMTVTEFLQAKQAGLINAE